MSLTSKSLRNTVGARRTGSQRANQPDSTASSRTSSISSVTSNRSRASWKSSSNMNRFTAVGVAGPVDHCTDVVAVELEGGARITRVELDGIFKPDSSEKRPRYPDLLWRDHNRGDFVTTDTKCHREHGTRWLCMGRFMEGDPPPGAYRTDFVLWTCPSTTRRYSTTLTGSSGFAKGEWDRINKARRGEEGEEVYRHNPSGRYFSKATARQQIEAKRAWKRIMRETRRAEERARLSST